MTQQRLGDGQHRGRLSNELRETDFLLSEKNVTNVKRGNVRLNSVVLEWNLRCWYELVVFDMHKHKTKYKCKCI